MLKTCLNKIKSYVPRHLRLGVCEHSISYELTQDVIETVPIVDDSGSVVRSEFVRKCLPSHDVMQKYKVSAFRLSALVKNGVPLKVVNINSSNTVRIEKLLDVCRSIDSADYYVQKVIEQQKERESWFKPIESEKSNV